MGSFRAKDADRDRFVELIEAAYVDGQLGAADRELRVGRALSAETLDELETLTRDLQLPQGYVPPAAAPTRSPSWLQPPLPSQVRRAGGVLVGLGVFVALVVAGVTGVVALAFFASSGTETSTSTEIQSAPAVPEVSVEEPAARSFRMTAPQVRAFLKAYEAEFGTLDVYEVGFYPTRVGVMVPVRGSRPRMERWSWDGAWTQDTEASRVIGPGGIVDLGTVDVRRMFANIATAKKVLRVQKGELTHVLVNRWFDDQASVNIYIGNSFNEGGYLKTAPSGEEIRRFPYEP
jgi:hypothetical protein